MPYKHPNTAAPMGRAANPTEKVAKVSKVPANGVAGKSSGKTSAATVPYSMKSYHSMMLPAVLAAGAAKPPGQRYGPV